MIPGWLQHLEWVAGTDWPEGNEDLMWAMEDSLKAVADRLRNRGYPAIDTAISALLVAYPAGDGREQIERDLKKVRTGPGSVEDLAIYFDALADAAGGFGTQISSNKWNGIISLGWLAAELAYASLFGPGAPFAQAGAIFATQRAFRWMGGRLLTFIGTLVGRMAISEGAKFIVKKVVYEIVQEALVEVFQGTVQELTVQGIHVAGGHQDGFDWGQVGFNAGISAIAGGAGGATGFGMNPLVSRTGLSDRGWGGALRGAMVGAGAGAGGAIAAWAATGFITKQWEFDPRMLTGGVLSGVGPSAVFGYRGLNTHAGAPMPLTRIGAMPGAAPTATIPASVTGIAPNSVAPAANGVNPGTDSAGGPTGAPTIGAGRVPEGGVNGADTSANGSTSAAGAANGNGSGPAAANGFGPTGSAPVASTDPSGIGGGEVSAGEAPASRTAAPPQEVPQDTGGNDSSDSAGGADPRNAESARVDQPSVGSAGIDQPGIDQTGVDQSGIDQTDARSSGVDRTGVDHGGVESGAAGAETVHSPGAGSPGSMDSGAIHDGTMPNTAPDITASQAIQPSGVPGLSGQVAAPGAVGPITTTPDTVTSRTLPGASPNATAANSNSVPAVESRAVQPISRPADTGSPRTQETADPNALPRAGSVGRGRPDQGGAIDARVADSEARRADIPSTVGNQELSGVPGEPDTDLPEAGLIVPGPAVAPPNTSGPRSSGTVRVDASAAADTDFATAADRSTDSLGTRASNPDAKYGVTGFRPPTDGPSAQPVDPPSTDPAIGDNDFELPNQCGPESLARVAARTGNPEVLVPGEVGPEGMDWRELEAAAGGVMIPLVAEQERTPHQVAAAQLAALGPGATILVVDEQHGPADEHGVGAHAYVMYNDSGVIMVDDPRVGPPFAFDPDNPPDVKATWGIHYGADGEIVIPRASGGGVDPEDLDATRPGTRIGSDPHQPRAPDVGPIVVTVGLPDSDGVPLPPEQRVRDAAVARDRVVDQLRALAWRNPDQIDDIRVIVSELVANSLDHSADPVHIEVRVTGVAGSRTLRVDVLDTNAARPEMSEFGTLPDDLVDTLDGEDLDALIAGLGERGRGLPMVVEMTADSGILDLPASDTAGPVPRKSTWFVLHEPGAQQPAMVPANTEPDPVIGVTAAEIEARYGIPLDRQRAIQGYADRHGLMISVRPGNPDSVSWINAGNPGKPELVKAKSVNALDVALGAPADVLGLVGFFRFPDSDTEVGDLRMPARGTVSEERWNQLLGRLNERRAEFGALRASMDKLVDSGRFAIRDGVVHGRDSDGELRALTGDHDLFDSRHADGSRLSPFENFLHFDRIHAERIGIQHPPLAYWNAMSRADWDIYLSLMDRHGGTDGEPLVLFRPGLDPALVRMTPAERVEIALARHGVLEQALLEVQADLLRRTVESPRDTAIAGLREQIADITRMIERNNLEIDPPPPETPVVPAVLETGTPAQVAEFLRGEHGIVVTGFDDPAIDAGVAREFAAAVHDVLSRFPRLGLREIRIADLESANTVAETRESARGDHVAGLGLNRRFAVAPRDLRTSIARAIDTGNIAPGHGERPVYSRIVHELGHALDIQGRRVASNRIAQVLRDHYRLRVGSYQGGFDGWLRQLSGYSFKGPQGSFVPHEAIAEAFADVEVLGPDASEPARVLHTLLVSEAQAADERARRIARGDGTTYWTQPAQGAKSHLEGGVPKNCAPEALRFAAEQLGIAASEIPDPDGQIPLRGVTAADFAAAAGGDWHRGGFASPDAAAALVRDTGAVILGVIEFSGLQRADVVGAHAFVMFRAENGAVIVHERVGDEVREYVHTWGQSSRQVVGVHGIVFEADGTAERPLVRGEQSGADPGTDAPVARIGARPPQEDTGATADPPDIPALVRAARAGDADAFATLRDLHVEEIRQRVTAGMPDARTAEEVVAETFARAARDIGTLGVRGESVTDWLLTIARTAAMDQARLNNFRRNVQAALLSAERVAETGAESQALASMTRTELRQALDLMGRGQRRAVMLRFWEGRSPAEVARALGLGQDAAQVMQRGAVRELARLIVAARGTGVSAAEATVATALRENPEGLRRAIDRLPRAQKEFAEQVLLRGQSFEAVAAATDRSRAQLAVVKSRAFRALAEFLAQDTVPTGAPGRGTAILTVQAARARDPEAFASAIQRLSPAEREFATLRFVDNLDAADIAARTGRSGDAMKALQSRATRRLAELLSGTETLTAQQRQAVVENAAESDPRGLRAALARLSDAQQRSIELQLLQGRSQSETAELMGRSENAVKALYREAMIRLTELLSGTAPAAPTDAIATVRAALETRPEVVHRNLVRLSADQRSAIELGLIQQRPVADIAAALGRTAEAVGALQRRAARKLADLIAADSGEAQTPRSEPNPRDTSVPEPTVAPLDTVRSADSDTLRTHIARLPRALSEVATHRFIDGLDIARTAQAMGRSDNAVAKLQARAVARLAEMLAGGITPDFQGGADLTLVRATQRDNPGAVRRALRELSPEQAKVIRMRIVQERTAADTATAMGRTETAINNLQRTAVARLAQLLTGRRVPSPAEATAFLENAVHDNPAAVRRAVARLPEQARVLAELRFVQGRKLIAVASALGRTEQATRHFQRQVVVDLAQALSAEIGPIPVLEDPGTRGELSRLVVGARDTAPAALTMAMRQLSDIEAQCLDLRFVQGRSINETAEAMGRSADGVLAVQRRALAKMPELLAAARAELADSALPRPPEHGARVSVVRALQQNNPEAFARAVGLLGEQQRALVDARFVRELSLDDTAAVMGLDRGRVIDIQRRAVRELTQLLADELPPDASPERGADSARAGSETPRWARQVPAWDLSGYDTPAQVAVAMTERWADRRLRVTGFDIDGLEVETAREFARAVDAMLTRYPEISLDEVRIGPFDGSHYGETQAVVRGLTVRTSFVALNAMWATNTDIFDSYWADEVGEGHMRGPVDRPAYGTIVHEFGHALVHAGRLEAYHRAEEALARYYVDTHHDTALDGFEAWLRTQFSGYSFDEHNTLNVEEAVPEAFAAVEHRGDRASEGEKILYHLVVEMAEAEAAAAQSFFPVFPEPGVSDADGSGTDFARASDSSNPDDAAARSPARPEVSATGWDLDGYDTAAAVGAALGERLGIPVVGFDLPGIDLDSARQYASTLEELLHTHPQPRVGEIRIGRLDDDELYMNAEWVLEHGRGRTVAITLNERFAADPALFVSRWRADVESGLRVGPIDQPVAANVVHEFGHLLDHVGANSARGQAEFVLMRHYLDTHRQPSMTGFDAWLRTQFSEYSWNGTTFVASEALAESFAAVRHHGEVAGDGARLLTALLLREAGAVPDPTVALPADTGSTHPNGAVLFPGDLPDGGRPLYRGIPRLLADGRVNPTYLAALVGAAVPRGEYDASYDEHVTQRTTESDTTSWSRQLAVARAFAKGDGLILEWRTGAPPDGAGWRYRPTMDPFDDFEQVLVQGTLTGTRAVRFLAADVNGPDPDTLGPVLPAGTDFAGHDGTPGSVVKAVLADLLPPGFLPDVDIDIATPAERNAHGALDYLAGYFESSDFVAASMFRPLDPGVLDRLESLDPAELRTAMEGRGVPGPVADGVLRRLNEIIDAGTITGEHAADSNEFGDPAVTEVAVDIDAPAPVVEAPIVMSSPAERAGLRPPGVVRQPGLPPTFQDRQVYGFYEFDRPLDAVLRARFDAAGARALSDRVAVVEGPEPLILVADWMGPDIDATLTEALDRWPDLRAVLNHPRVRIRYLLGEVDSAGQVTAGEIESPEVRHGVIPEGPWAGMTMTYWQDFDGYWRSAPVDVPTARIPPPRTAPDLPADWPMRPHYAGESDPADPMYRGIHYMSPAERESTRLFVGPEGRLHSASDGRPFHSGWVSGDWNRTEFVIDGSGNIYADTRQVSGRLAHSSFLAGGDVAAVGTIQVHYGRPIAMDEHSGHYWPTAEINDRGVRSLLAQGVVFSHGFEQLDHLGGRRPSLVPEPPPPGPMYGSDAARAGGYPGPDPEDGVWDARRHTTASEVAAALAGKHGLNVTGFDIEDIDVDIAREVADAVDRLLTDYPATALREIRIAPLPEGVFARTDSSGPTGGPRITLNEQYAIDPDLFRYEWENSESGAAIVGPLDRPGHGVIAYELGRLLDLEGGGTAQRLLMRELFLHYRQGRAAVDRTEFTAWLKRQFSFDSFGQFGAFRPAAALAEAHAAMANDEGEPSDGHRISAALLARQAAADTRVDPSTSDIGLSFVAPEHDGEWGRYTDARGIAEALTDGHGVVVTGFDLAGVDVETAREYARAIDLMLERHPGVDLAEIRIAPLEENVFGRTMAIAEHGRPSTTSIIILNERYAADPLLFQHDWAEAVEVGFCAGPMDRPVFGAVVHEFGHAVDVAGRYGARSRGPLLLAVRYRTEFGADTAGFGDDVDRRYRDWLEGQLSRYSLTPSSGVNIVEALPEAFAAVTHAELSPDVASATETQRLLHDALLRAVESVRESTDPDGAEVPPPDFLRLPG
ncbi:MULTISPECIES: sigma factor-like helix-turn-helix DNA-binding protein [Nocardia]|uniref:sigma factor-like helix-turn-helix DNA-binding protein n=1 Tax=Nocardia TaxID=1817 RepID=UPI000D6A0489|nr:MULTISPECIES: sigma factor-like helix-turn-helix DNA-binding protein [Nocardia]